jgi:hypothetical protein
MGQVVARGSRALPPSTEEPEIHPLRATQAGRTQQLQQAWRSDHRWASLDRRKEQGQGEGPFLFFGVEDGMGGERGSEPRNQFKLSRWQGCRARPSAAAASLKVCPSEYNE